MLPELGSEWQRVRVGLLPKFGRAGPNGEEVDEDCVVRPEPVA